MAISQIRAIHPDLAGQKSTTLTADIVAGTSVVCTVNNTGYGSTRSVDDVFANNDYVVFGYPGQSDCEIAKISAAVTSTNSITVDRLEHAHAPGTPITFSLYDKIELFTSTSETGTYSSAYSSTPKTISWNLPETILDYSGSDTWAKFKFFNTTTSTYSDFSTAIALTLPIQRGSLRWIMNRIRELTNLRDQTTISDASLIELINDEQIFICNELFPKFSWFLETEQDLTTVTGQYRYELPSDFMAMKEAIYNDYISPSAHTRYFISEVSLPEMRRLTASQTQATSDNIRYYALENNTYINIYPAPTTAGKTIFLFYVQRPVRLENDTDTTKLPDPTLIVDRACMALSNYSKDINMNYFSYRYQQNIDSVKRQKLTNRARQLR